MHRLAYAFDQRFGRCIDLLGQCLFDPCDGKLFAHGILCLGQAVGVKEDGGERGDVGLLQLVAEVVEESDGDVGKHGQGADVLRVACRKQVGHVVTCVAVAESARGKVEHAHEEGDEDVGDVAFASRSIECLHDACRVGLVHRSHAELRMYLGHDDSRRDALAADVADAEEQLLVAQEVVIDVASHLACRFEHAEDLHVVRLGLCLPTLPGAGRTRSEVARQHFVLYGLGDAKLLVDQVLTCLRLTKSLFAAHRTMDDEAQQSEAQQHEEHQLEAHHVECAIHLVVVAHHGHLPVGLAPHVGEIDVGAFAGLLAVEGDECRTSAMAQLAHRRAVAYQTHHLLHVVRIGMTRRRARDDLPRAGEQQIERRGIGVAGIERVADLFEREVDAADAHKASFAVGERKRIGGEFGFGRIGGVKVGVAPRRLQFALHLLIGGMQRVVVLPAFAQLRGEDVLPLTVGIGFEQPSLLRVVKGPEGNEAAHGMGRTGDNPGGGCRNRIGLRQVPVDVPKVFAQRIFLQVEDAFDDDGLDAYLVFGTVVELLLHQPMRCVVLDGREKLDQYSGYDDDEDVPVHL